MFRYSLAFLLLFISSSCFAQKAACAYERAQLKNIQAAMRTIYNSDSIIEEEQRRYANYQNCKEHQKNNRKTKKSGSYAFKKPYQDKIKKGYNQSVGKPNNIPSQGSHRKPVRINKAKIKKRKRTITHEN